MRFTKYHALGNDYLVIEPYELAGLQPDEVARVLCHRNYGPGADGLLVGPNPGEMRNFSLSIINPDGSYAEKSGNGLRIFARYLWDTKRVTTDPFSIFPPGGEARAQIGPNADWIAIGMGRPQFSSDAVGISGPAREMLGAPLEVAGQVLQVATVSVGNPHCVVLEGPVTPKRAKELGPVIENSGIFRNRTNVQLLEVLSRSAIRIEIWERGAGYTLASGSSACAAASAAYRLGWCDAMLSVHMPGGRLEVVIAPDGEITQRGPVVAVATGSVAEDTLDHVRTQSLPHARSG
jgi:diaminopimelate epimerase